MQELGTNTIRIYNSNPTTRQASEDPANDIPYPLGKDHIPFMDLADSFGFKVIYSLYADNSFIATGNTAQLYQYLEWQIDEVGNHSALLMFAFGNELNLFGDQTLIPIVNDAINYARTYLKTKWNRSVPFTTAVVDLPQSYPVLVPALDVDVFTTNAGYRGFSFTDLWSNPDTGLYNLSCTYNKPVLIGEIGFLSLDNAATYLYPDWFNQVWQDLVGHIDQGCVGGAFFEYSDEPLTKVDPTQQALGVVALAIIDNSDQPNVFVADQAIRKDIIFASVANGTYQNGPYNMNSDVFALIGRAPYTLYAAQASVCGAGTIPPQLQASTATSTTTGQSSNTPAPSTSSSAASTSTSTSGSTSGSDESQSTSGSTSGSVESESPSTTGSESATSSSAASTSGFSSTTGSGSESESTPTPTPTPGSTSTAGVIQEAHNGANVLHISVTITILAVVLSVCFTL